MAIAKYKKPCGKNTPGNSRLFTTEIANITGLTNTAGEISAVTMEALATFKEFDVDIDTLQVSGEGNAGATTVNTPTIQALFGKNTAALRSALNGIAEQMSCGIAAIILDNNGNAWLFGFNDVELGERPLNKMTYNFDSGVTLADEGVSAYTVTFSGTSQVLPLPFDDALKASIKDGTAAFIEYN